MNILFDSSALFKRYSGESGLAQVQQAQRRATRITVAAHCRTELVSALSRQWREGLFSHDEYDRVLSDIDRDFEDFAVVPLTDAVERHALAAMRQAPLRAMDALHVGTAQVADVDLFVTADRRQAEGARVLGVITDLVEASGT